MPEVPPKGFPSVSAAFRFRFDASEKLLEFARTLRREERCESASIEIMHIDNGECLLVCTWAEPAGMELGHLIEALHGDLRLLCGGACLGYMLGPSAVL